MPADHVLQALNAAHRTLLGLSRGRLGWQVAGMPVLRLTTTGRRSGRRRAVLLTSPVRLGSSFVVVASRGGDDKPPAWLLNLRAQPRVEVELRGTVRPMRARQAGPAERAALWSRIVAEHPLYGRYQSRTAREIALVVLEPVG